MKPTILLVACFAFAVARPSRAQEAVAPKPPQPIVEEFRRRALEHLRAQRPDLKPEQLQLLRVSYIFEPAAGSRPASEGTFVEFLDPSSRTQESRLSGGTATTTRIVQVAFRRDATERVEVGTSASRVEYGE